MTIDEIFAKCNQIKFCHIMIYSSVGWREEVATDFTCVIKRSGEDDKIEVSRNAKSAGKAAEAAWEAFSRLIDRGLDASEKLPALLAKSEY